MLYFDYFFLNTELGNTIGLSNPFIPTVETPKKKLSITIPSNLASETFPTNLLLSQVGDVVSLQYIL